MSEPNNEDEQNLLPLSGSFNWSDQSHDNFVDSLLDNQGMSEILSLNKLLDDDKFDDVDFLVEKTHDKLQKIQWFSNQKFISLISERIERRLYPKKNGCLTMDFY